jgi:hypothetical protein
MNQGRWIGIAAALACIALCIPAQAQRMYRCGNAYQDRPCDPGTQGKVIGSTGGRQSSATTVTDQECAKRGIDAQKIMWIRETGKTADMQLASANSAGQKKLISDVYAKSGTSNEVRAAIEADCVAEKKRAEQAAELNAAAARLRGQDQPAAVTTRSAPGSGADAEAAAARQREKSAAGDAATKKTRCDDFTSRLQSIGSQQRLGGSNATMERLKRNREDVLRRQSEAGCS